MTKVTKKKIMLFLGAGFSTLFDKPVTSEFKEKINYFDGFYRHFLEYEEFKDIEHILQSLHELKNLMENTEHGRFLNYLSKKGFIKYGIGPHMKSYVFDNQLIPTLAEELDKLNEKIDKVEDNIFDTYKWDKEDDKNLQIIHPLIEFLQNHSNELIVATTNYDIAIERFCENYQKYDLVDGFELKIKKWIWPDNNVFHIPDNYDPNKDIILYKLHGSLGWKINLDGKIEKTHEEHRTDGKYYGRNLVIFPTLSPKEDEDKPPFNGMITAFKEKLKDVDVCIIIGFSLRDEGIVEIFNEFISDGKIIIIVDEKGVENISDNVVKKHDFKRWEFVFNTSIMQDGQGMSNAPISLDEHNIFVIGEYIKENTLDKILSVIEILLDRIESNTKLGIT